MSDLPRGWATATLGEIGIYLNGRGFKKSEWRDSGRPIVRIQNLTGSGGSFNYFQGEADDRHVARDGDLLVSWAATLGVYVWRGPEAVINQHIFKVESHIDPRFHRYVLEATLDDLRRQTHGSGMVHITKGRFDATSVALPPLNEQRRIVAAIEEHLSRLDAADASLAAALRRLDALRDVTLRTAVSGEHPCVRLADVASVVSGQTPKGLVTSSVGEIPYYKVGDMNAAEGRRMGPARAYLSDTQAAAAKLRLHPPGTVIFPKRGGAIATNKKRLLTAPAALDLNTMAVIPGEGLLSEYLLAYFETIDLGTLSDGSNVPQINHDDIAPLQIPLPPLEEQRRIVAEVEERTTRIDAMRASIERAQRRSKALRAAILERAFRGELVPQDPADEPAESLLARIRADRTATERRRGRPSGI
jgi:type I restriction enzyme S subunit